MNRAARFHFPAILLFALLLTLAASSENLSQTKTYDLAKAEDLNRQGVLKVSRKQFNDAAQLFALSIEADPRFPQGHMNLGTALMLLGKPAEGLPHIRRSIELAPDSHEAMNQLGVTYDKLGKPDQAIEAFRRSVELKPDYALGYFNLGAAYFWEGKLDLAKEALERSKSLDPKRVDSRMYLSVLHAKQKKLRDAIAEIKWVTESHPENEEANLILCRLFLMDNDRSAALGMYQTFKATNASLAEEMFKSIFSENVIDVSTLGRP